MQVSRELLRRYNDNKVRDFAELAVGMEDDTGNYSAAEHRLGPRIAAANQNWQKQVFDLAGQFKELKDASVIPDLIVRANLRYLQISVGSEISCMVNPDVCWVCNVRTIWLHLAWTKGPGKAEQELALYRESASDSDMAYITWAAVYHPLIQQTLYEVATEGRNRAKAQGITVQNGRLFLWADAIAAYAYDSYHGKNAKAGSMAR